MILDSVIELKRRKSDSAYYIYRKPCDREQFLVESCEGLEIAQERARWLAERDIDEFHVFDPRMGQIVFKAQQEWQPGLKLTLKYPIDSQRI